MLIRVLALGGFYIYLAVFGPLFLMSWLVWRDSEMALVCGITSLVLIVTIRWWRKEVRRYAQQNDFTPPRYL